MKALRMSRDGLPLPLSYLGTATFARLCAEGAPVVIVILALDRTGDAWLGGLLVAVMTLPHVVTGPLSGRIRDRIGRPGATTAVAALTVAVILAALAALVGVAPWPVVVAIAAAESLVAPLLLGGLSSLLGGLTEPRQHRSAHALDAATYTGAGIAGPALGAAVAAFFSPATGLAALAAAAAVAALFAAALPAVEAGGGAPARLTAGFDWIRRQPDLLRSTIMSTLAHGGLGALPVLAPLLAVGIGADPATGGWLISAFAAGAVLGSLAMTHPAAAALPPLRVMSVSLVTIAGGLGLAATVTAVVPAMICFAVAGIAEGPLLAMTLHLRTALSPSTLRTQVFMAGASAKLTFSAAGAAAAGLASGVDSRTLLVAAAAVVACSAVPGLRGRATVRDDLRE